MEYAKLENGKLTKLFRLPSGTCVLNQKLVRNPTESDILAAGYLPIHETEEPETKEGFVKSFRWVQTDNAIIKRWTVKRDMRPLSQSEVTSKLIAQQINTLAVDDNTALRMSAYYPQWEPGTEYRPVGYKVRHNEKLWKLRSEHTSQTGWEPGAVGTESLWEQVNESHSGTIDDAIPYNGNMTLEKGKYYTQGEVIYHCYWDTGIPVYNPLAELVGIYVEEV